MIEFNRSNLDQSCIFYALTNNVGLSCTFDSYAAIRQSSNFRTKSAHEYHDAIKSLKVTG